MDSSNEMNEIERVQAEPISGGRLRAEDLCVGLGIGREILEICLRWEVIDPPEPGAGGIPLFSEAAMERVRRGVRLHYDLGINWAGVAVVLDLLDRMESLEREMHPRFEDI